MTESAGTEIGRVGDIRGMEGGEMEEDAATDEEETEANGNMVSLNTT